MSILYFKRALLLFQICIRDKFSGATVLDIHTLKNNNKIIKHVFLKHSIHDKCNIFNIYIYILALIEHLQFFFDQ